MRILSGPPHLDHPKDPPSKLLLIMLRYTRVEKSHIRVHHRTTYNFTLFPFLTSKDVSCQSNSIFFCNFSIPKPHTLHSLCKNTNPLIFSILSSNDLFQKVSPSKEYFQHHFPKRALLSEERDLIPRSPLLISLLSIDHFTKCILFSEAMLPKGMLLEFS